MNVTLNNSKATLCDAQEVTLDGELKGKNGARESCRRRLEGGARKTSSDD